MNIRVMLLGIATMGISACAANSAPQASQTDEDQQDLMASPACGPVCVSTPENSFLAAAYGPDCATAYANALANALPVTRGNCTAEGYMGACSVTSTPQYCYWVPSVGQYEGYTQINQGCRDTTC